MLVLFTLLKDYQLWLSELLEQHRDFPNVIRWVFVERVPEEGRFSISQKLIREELRRLDSRVSYLQSLDDPYDEPKEQIRKAKNLALDEVELTAMTHHVKYIYQLNPDEFLTRYDQMGVVDALRRACAKYLCCLFRHRHIYRPNAWCEQGIFKKEIGGRPSGSLLQLRAFKYVKGMRYTTSHFWPSTPGGILYTNRLKRYDTRGNTPEIINLSHVDRGELLEESLPRSETVIPYTGSVPEVFRKSEVAIND